MISVLTMDTVVEDEGVVKDLLFLREREGKREGGREGEELGKRRGKGVPVPRSIQRHCLSLTSRASTTVATRSCTESSVSSLMS